MFCIHLKMLKRNDELMNIHFRKEDAEYVLVQDIRKDIADIIYENTCFIEMVCEILLGIYELHNNITKEIDEEFKLREYKIDQKDLPAFNRLKDLFCDYFILIQDFGFEAKLRQYNPREFKSYRLDLNEKKLNVFRGVLFEAIIESFIKYRYLETKFETGCVVLVNNHEICIYYDNGKRKKTIDIAGWDDRNKAGEFYECKIRPKNFNEENYRYLNKIETILRSHHVRNYRIAFVSADSQDFVESKIKEIQATVTYKPKNIELFGRNFLTSMINFSFPEIA